MSPGQPFIPSALVPLAGDHDASGFDCGEPRLDSWLREHAARTQRRNLSATHVWAGTDNRILAYVTLIASVVARSDLPKATGHGYPDTIPAILLGRLALDKTLRGQKLGSRLLAEALTIAARSAASVAAAFVVVDALHEQAAEFYLHHGFTRLPGTERLVLKVATIAVASEATAPDSPSAS